MQSSAVFLKTKSLCVGNYLSRFAVLCIISCEILKRNPEEKQRALKQFKRSLKME